jgi:hypothetical protein
MKIANFFLLIVLFVSTQSIGQMRFHHKINPSTIAKFGFELRSGPTGAIRTLCQTRKGIITVSGGKIFVDIWQITDGLTCVNGLDSTTSLIGLDLQLTDSRQTLGRPTKILVLPFSAVNIGVNTIPFRLRKKVFINETGTKTPSSGTTGFQLALNAGYTRGFSQITTRSITNWSVTVGAYAGPSTAELKKESVEQPSLWSTNQTNATMTYGLNLILARNNLGLVFAYGFENALGPKRKEWVYNGEPYFGFGVNTSFMR